MSSSTNTFERTNPFNGSVASVTHAASINEALATVNAAKAAFPAWSAMGPHARRVVLLKAADLLEARRSQFIEINQAETGATAPWIGFNVSIGAKILREAASMTTQIAGEVLPSEKPGAFSTGIRQPAGVCLGIAPWNAAIILGVRAIAMPLACGNTAILKASEMSPQTHTMIVQTLLDAGIPKGVVSVISHDPKDAPTIVEALIRSPAIRRVNFTGSTGVGKVIAKLCAEELKPCLLELGGKAPFIVLDDADLEGAVNGAAFGSFMNMRLYSEESFGPVKPIIRVDNAEHAIEVANDTEYGLSGAIYTSNIKQGMALAAQLESGICHINGPTVADEPQAPFGGVKASGIGRFGGKAGIAEFTDLRWITIEDPQQSYPF